MAFTVNSVSIGIRWNYKQRMTLDSFCIPFNPISPRGGGHILPPCHVFAYSWANTRTSVLKELDVPKYAFGKGQYPIKLSRLAEKNSVHKNTTIL